MIEETWNRGRNVRFWRMPLTQSVAEFTDAGFVIERLVEPRPVAQMADEYRDDYDKLQSEPGFIAFRLIKR